MIFYISRVILATAKGYKLSVLFDVPLVNRNGRIDFENLF